MDSDLVDMSGVLQKGRGESWEIQCDDGKTVSVIAAWLEFLGHKPIEGARLDFVARELVTKSYHLEQIVQFEMPPLNRSRDAS